MAIKSDANGLSGENSIIFAYNDFPESVRDAISFGLKLNGALID